MATPLLVTNDFLPQVGGIQQYAANIARRLHGSGVLAAAHPESGETDALLPFPVRRGSSRFLLPTPATARLLTDTADQLGADVVVFLAPFPLAPLGTRQQLPWALCTHGAELVVPSRIPAVRRLYRLWLRGARCLFAVSAYTGGHLRTLVGPDGPPIRFLRPGVDLERFSPAVDGTAVRNRHGLGEDPVVVCIGRMVRRKGQDVLIQALPQIRRRVPRARLLLVGGGPDRRRLQAAAERLPAGSVTFAGRVREEDLPAYYAAGDVFATPNRARWRGLEQEGFGMIFVEAQACGRPVVAGRSGGAPETLLEGETGILVDGGSVDEVSRALADLLTDRARCRRMGAAGRRFVEEQFDWDRIVERLSGDLAVLARGGVPLSEL